MKNLYNVPVLPASLEKLISSLSKLPGIGRKSAQRLAYYLLRSHKSLARDIGESLLTLENGLMLCGECYLIADADRCAVCRNPRRDQHVICVVEHVFDAEAVERSGEYRGLYHVLHGRIAPLDRVAPEDIKIKELVARVSRLSKNGQSAEIILATNPSSEGEQTALYIQKLLKPFSVKITRIATGIPVGADLEYADEITLARAMKGRQEY